jgi:hypothetical protein
VNRRQFLASVLVLPFGRAIAPLVMTGGTGAGQIRAIAVADLTLPGRTTMPEVAVESLRAGLMTVEEVYRHLRDHLIEDLEREGRRG